MNLAKKPRPLPLKPRRVLPPVRETDDPESACNAWRGSKEFNLSDDEVSAIQSGEVAAVVASKAISEHVGHWIIDQRSLDRWRARRAGPVSL